MRNNIEAEPNFSPEREPEIHELLTASVEQVLKQIQAYQGCPELFFTQHLQRAGERLLWCRTGVWCLGKGEQKAQYHTFSISMVWTSGFWRSINPLEVAGAVPGGFSPEYALPHSSEAQFL